MISWQQCAIVERLRDEFPIAEDQAQLIFPQPDGPPFVFLREGNGMYGIELAHDDTLESLREKMQAGLEELRHKLTEKKG